MHIQDIFKTRATTFSFEFFPPKTDKASNELFETIAQLQALQPSFVSVTYGAGGSTRERTHDLIVRIQRETRLTAVSHLTCVCHSQDELAAILDRYAESEIENILAPGWRPARGRCSNYDRSRDAFQYADQLVRFIRSRTQRGRRRGFGIGVAGFPEGHPDHAQPAQGDGVSQEQGRCRRRLHLHPALLQQRRFLTTSASAASWPASACRSSPGSCRSRPRKTWHGWPSWPSGTRFPAQLLRAIGRCGDDPHAVAKVGIHWATEQCRDLLDNQVRGIHFYTLNRSDATRQIYENLGVKDSISLEGRQSARASQGG